MMKKQLLLAIILLGILNIAEAQKPDTATLLVHYKFTHVRDTTDRAHPYTENMVLLMGKNASVYRSYDGMVADEQFKKAYIAAAANSPNGQVMINRTGAGSRTQYYQYPNEQKMLTKENVLINSYLIDGPMPVIDWKIGSDTATFGDLHCQIATCHFKGRDYTAWFCPDLPIHTGPWKLNGLPGLIVDAHDAKNEVVFQFDGAEKAAPSASKIQLPGGENPPPILAGLDENPNLITPPAKAIKTTQKDFDQLALAMQKDPNAVAQGMVAANRANGQGGDNIKVKAGPRRVENNPIELTDKN